RVVRTQIGMAASRDHWKPAVLDFRDGGSRQPCAGPHHDKTSGPPEGKSLVARTLGKTFVAFSQLQCSRKPSRAAVRNSMKNYSKKPCSTALLRLSNRGGGEGRPDSLLIQSKRLADLDF